MPEDSAPVRDPAAAARDHLLTEHAGTLAAVVAAADRVATDWPTLLDGRRATADRDRVVDPLRAELERSGLLARLPDLLAGAVDAAGYDLEASPVPAPPYVAVTGTGPVLRATVADGRLVVGVDCFEVVRDASFDDAGGPEAADDSRDVADEAERGVVYALRPVAPEAALSVRFRPGASIR